MREVVLLPMGDQSHIDNLLERLGVLVDSGREGEFAMILPSSHLLHRFRHRLVQTASRQLNLTTFDDLVAAAQKYSGSATSGLDGTTVTEILADIIEKRAKELSKLGRYAGSRGMAQELAYVLAQLRRGKVSPCNLQAALEHNPDSILADLLIIWQDYQSFLQARNLADLEVQYALAAGNLSFIPWLRAVREIHVCWFFDFEPLQTEILDRLPEDIDVTIWLPFQHPAHDKYIDQTIQVLAGMGYSVRRDVGNTSALVRNLFLTSTENGGVYNARGFAAPRLKQELEFVAREIKKLAGQGVALHDICLVVPDQQKYLPTLRRLYREHGVELAIPQVTDLTAVPWVREVLALWQAVGTGWDGDSLRQLASSTYITAHLPNGCDGDAVDWAITSLGGNLRGQQWLAKLDKEIQRLSGQLEECEGWLRGSLERSLELYQAARSGILGWLELGAVLGGTHSPQGHCQNLLQLLEDNAQVVESPGEGEEIRDRLARDKFLAAVQAYLACSKLLSHTVPISANQFAEDFSPWLKRDLSLERSNPGAVGLFSPSQVRGLKFKYVFILGLNQGAFPRTIREHWLLDQIAKLPGLSRVQRQPLAQEKIFFHSCVAAAQGCLYLSRVLPGVEEDAEASSFWQEVDALMEGGLLQETLDSQDLLPPLQADAITSPGQLCQSLVYELARGGEPSLPLVTWLRSREEYPHLLAASRVEQRRESPLPADNMDGVLAGSSDILQARMGRAVYSISRLEQYARCPFSFFARFCLGLESAPQDVPEYSALDRGTLLHWLLERFYTAHLEQADVNKPQTIRIPLEALARQWLEERGHEPEDFLWRFRAGDAVSMVQALIEVDLPWLELTGLRPALLEASFGLPGSSIGPVQPGGGPVSFQGKIDRIDVLERAGVTWAVVYDYKTSREITQGDILSGRSLQVPVYLAAVPELLAEKGYTNVRVMGGGYYVISSAKLAGGIWDKEFTSWAKKGLGSLETGEFQALEQGLADRAEKLHQKILAGYFPPEPAPRVCNYCDFSRCCRYDKNRFILKKGGLDNATQR